MTAVCRRAGFPDLVVPSESAEQRGHVARMKALARTRPGLETLHAIPNGGSRKPIEAAIMKAEGVESGYPDLALDQPSHGYHGLRIEMKRAAFGLESASKWGAISMEQLSWIMRLSQAGYYATVCRGGRHADAVTLAYLDGDFAALRRLESWWLETDLPRYIKVPAKKKAAKRSGAARVPTKPTRRRYG